LLHNHTHLSSGAGKIGQKWPQYKGLSSTPLAIKNTLMDENSILINNTKTHENVREMSENKVDGIKQ
jgi:hypothetical protein